MTVKPLGIVFTKDGATKFAELIEKIKPVKLDDRINKTYEFTPSKAGSSKFDRNGIYKK